MNYPKSSCPSAFCPLADPPRRGCIPGSLGTCNCSIPAWTNCKSTNTFHKNIQPDPRRGYTDLNELGIRKDGRYKPYRNPEGEIVYVGTNPKLIDAARGQMLVLDQPPFSGAVREAEIYEKPFTQYGGRYATYGDINAGQIRYYVDQEMAAPYHEPVFDIPSSVTYQTYSDPNGALHHHYNREPLQPYGWTHDESEIRDSATYDQIAFRESLMASQQRPRLSESWTARWASA